MLPTPDGIPYALAYLELPRVTLLGWCFTQEAKGRKPRTDRGDPAYYVPQDELHPIASLRLWLASESWTMALLS
jgi:hypothetical protein